jgi:hypothetical protein
MNIFENSNRLEMARCTSHEPHSLVSVKNIAPFLSEQTWLIKNRFHKWSTLRHKKLVRAFWYRGRNDPMEIWEKRAMDEITAQFDEMLSQKRESLGKED